MRADIDKLLPERGLIQLSADAVVDMDVDNFKLTRLHGDVLFCEYIDMSEDGESILRNGIFVPLHVRTQAWRKARVIIAGVDAKWSKEDEIVLFPNNYGVAIENLEIDGKGKIKHGVFLNESRIFGVCVESESE
jgi:hypothetical protein